MKVVVLGSGVVGTCSAWWLLQHGHEVVVIDREAGPAQETSFANGGQISVSYAEPWANPQAPLKLLNGWAKPTPPCCFAPSLTGASGYGAWPFCVNACHRGWHRTFKPWSGWLSTAMRRLRKCVTSSICSTTSNCVAF